MRPPLLQLSDICLSFGRMTLLDGATFSISPGERSCLVGRNGSGKSTLLKIAAGLIEPDRGARFLQPGTTIRYMAQEPDFSGYDTTLSYIQGGLTPSDNSHRAQYFCEQLDLDANENLHVLSGGEARRAALARALAPSPDILLLDEPTNHLDLPTIEWLEKELAQTRSALVLISHDRRFLENLSRSTIWLDRGQLRRIEMGFGAFENWRDDFLAGEEQDRHKLDRKINAEEDWLRYGVTARRKRNVGRLAKLQALKKNRRDYQGVAGKAVIKAGDVDRPGSMVIEADNISKSFDGRKIVENFSTRIARGDRVGIIGPNGSGKTTLLNLLTGILAPDKGHVRLGTNLKMTVLDQRRDELKPELSLRDYLTGGGSDVIMLGKTSKHVIAYMRDFLFTPEQAGTPLGVLSGGERGRVALARALAKSSNMLVLDEPTNDLDLETLDVLQEMLSDYSGTVIVISHDRDFLDRSVNMVIAPEKNGQWLEFAGGYTDMLAQRGADIGPRKLEKTKATAKTTPQKLSSGGKRRLSFHEKHALETLPKEIAKLQANLRELQSKLEDPGLYKRDRKAFETASERLTATQTELAKAEEKWLELEILRAELEAK